MQPGRRSVMALCVAVLVLMLACEDEGGVSRQKAGSTARPEYTGEFEVKSQLAQTISNGALSYDLKANVPFKIAWSDENSRWKLTGTDPKAQGVVTLAGGGVNCTGYLTGNVQIVGYVYPERLKPCEIRLTLFQQWSGATLVCNYSFPFVHTLEMPNGSAPFSNSDDFFYVATSGYHSKQVSYINGVLTGTLQIKMKSFSGATIDGCGVTY